MFREAVAWLTEEYHLVQNFNLDSNYWKADALLKTKLIMTYLALLLHTKALVSDCFFLFVLCATCEQMELFFL